jgi:hypothetical protein
MLQEQKGVSERNVNELETNKQRRKALETYLCRGINEFKSSYHPGTDLVKTENRDLLWIPTIQ